MVALACAAAAALPNAGRKRYGSGWVRSGELAGLAQCRSAPDWGGRRLGIAPVRQFRAIAPIPQRRRANCKFWAHVTSCNGWDTAEFEYGTPCDARHRGTMRLVPFRLPIPRELKLYR